MAVTAAPILPGLALLPLTALPLALGLSLPLAAAIIATAATLPAAAAVVAEILLRLRLRLRLGALALIAPAAAIAAATIVISLFAGDLRHCAGAGVSRAAGEKDGRSGGRNEEVFPVHGLQTDACRLNSR
ncbi:MAG: hypothetical protein ABUS57_19695 [Pseudomonadota bacterium]